MTETPTLDVHETTDVDAEGFTAGESAHQFCTFTVDGMFFGIEVRQVQEVLRYQELTRVPTAPASVSGLINLRGQIVTAIDLRVRLGLPPLPEGRRPMNVVIKSADGVISLLVDEIGDVIPVSEATFEKAPETLKPSARAYIHGVYKLKDRLLLILDADKAVDIAG